MNLRVDRGQMECHSLESRRRENKSGKVEERTPYSSLEAADICNQLWKLYDCYLQVYQIVFEVLDNR